MELGRQVTPPSRAMPFHPVASSRYSPGSSIEATSIPDPSSLAVGEWVVREVVIGASPAADQATAAPYAVLPSNGAHPDARLACQPPAAKARS
jgi:hypothetical protein